MTNCSEGQRECVEKHCPAGETGLVLRVMPEMLAVCQVEDLREIDFSGELFFVGKTDEEISVVCDVEHIPGNTISCERGWRAFRIQGTLDFSLIGILSRIAGVLAENKIGIFAVSTYNTDYILTKEENFGRALAALEKEGYIIEDYHMREDKQED